MKLKELVKQFIPMNSGIPGVKHLSLDSKEEELTFGLLFLKLLYGEIEDTH